MSTPTDRELALQAVGDGAADPEDVAAIIGTADTPRPPMTQSEPVLTAGPLDRFECDSCGKWPQFRNWPNHILAYPSHRATLAAQSSVQPVLSGLDDTSQIEQAVNRFADATHQPRPYPQPVLSGLDENLLAQAVETVSLTPVSLPDEDEDSLSEVEWMARAIAAEYARLAATAPAAYNAAISDAQQVLRDMPGISDNDGSQPRPEPDYIERAEAVAEVEKLRR